MSPNREDYLKAIFNANEQGAKLTNKALAEELGISAASSSEMITKLVEAGKVIRDSKRGIILSESGEVEAIQLVRKHRLWEVFLVEHLGYTWDEVHEEAELLEHVTSDTLEARLDAFLGSPAYCPHGSVVYGNQEVIDTVSLSQIPMNERVTLMEVSDDPAILKTLETHHIALGQSIMVLKKGAQVLLDVESRQVVLDDAVVELMLVKREM